VQAALHRPDAEPVPVKAAYADLLELAVPLAAMGLAPGAPVEFQVRLHAGDLEVEAHPPASLITFQLLAADWPLHNWTV
jgi:hypothetical protein